MNLELVYYLLLARYSNSVIASSDENRFSYQLFSIIFQYGPSWAKELEIQKELRALDVSAFQKGNVNIVNVAGNPSGAPSTQDTDELPYVQNQNVSKTTRNIADGYALQLSLLKEDVTEDFLRRFQKLFLTIVEPEAALWYVTYGDGDEETDDGNIYDGVTMTRNFRNRYFSQIYPTYEEFLADWNSTPFPAAL